MHRLADDARHPVQIESGTSLFHVTRAAEGPATSSHHQAIDEVGRGLRVSARHADGTAEAFEWSDPMRKPWMLGVQWHPERMALTEGLAGPLFVAFLQAVRGRTH